MRTSEWLIMALSVALLASGIMLQAWLALCAAALLLAVSGRWFVALVLACALDVLFGPPVGSLHALHFPFVLCVLVIVLVQAYAIRHIRQA
jgi:hypothetical protein